MVPSELVSIVLNNVLEYVIRKPAHDIGSDYYISFDKISNMKPPIQCEFDIQYLEPCL